MDENIRMLLCMPTVSDRVLCVSQDCTFVPLCVVLFRSTSTVFTS